jgi:hypothetical protein
VRSVDGEGGRGLRLERGSEKEKYGKEWAHGHVPAELR